MFRLLRLKPPHGWNAVAWELAIVTLGVLIALGAQQLVDDWRWRKQVTQANDIFKNELGQAAEIAYERLAIQPCLTNRLKELSARLNEPGSQWRGMPEQFHGAKAFYSSVLPVVYRPPVRPMLIDGWSNALSNGTINHLSADRALTLSTAYNIVQKFDDLQNEETETATKLTLLATDRVLSPEARLELLQVVSGLDRINSRMVTESKDLLEAVKAADLGYNDAEVSGYAQDIVRQQTAYRGSCVTAPPIDLN